MRDITIDISLLGRIRYAGICLGIYICAAAGAAVLAWVILDDINHLFHHEHIRGIDIVMPVIGLPVCVALLWCLPQMLWKYPVLWSSRLELQWGNVSLLSRKGVVLAEINRAKVDQESNGFWFRNPHHLSDAFEVPYYMISKQQRAALLVAIRL